MVRSKRNFLKQVITRIDFAVPLRSMRTRINQRFIRARIKHYPIQEPIKMIKDASRLLSEPAKIRTMEKRTDWFFHSRNREEKLCINDTCMFIDVGKYESFLKLQSHFVSVLESLFNNYKNVSISRFGLRYINHIEENELDPTDWNGYLNSDLLSIFEFADSREAISRAFHILDMNYDDMNLTFQYGMHNPDYPAPIRKKLFVLDFDAYIEAALTKEEVLRNLDIFHGKIESYFERCFLEKGRKVLNE